MKIENKIREIVIDNFKTTLKHSIDNHGVFRNIMSLEIEIEGNWHLNTKKGIKQTNKRNSDYEYAKIKLLWMTPKEILDAKSDDELAGLILGLLDKPHTYFVP